MVSRPADIGAFQFVKLTALRAAQLMRGCRPRVDGTHKPIVIAHFEVAEGKVTQATDVVTLNHESGGVTLDPTPSTAQQT